MTHDLDPERQGSSIADLATSAPFFMTVVSGGNRWMYLASTGGLTAGRRTPDGCLFAYETDDRLCAADGTVGPRSILWVDDGSGQQRWEPFLRAADGQYRVQRSLWKSAIGDEVRFGERNDDLELQMSYGWRSGDAFGFVRHVELRNDGRRPVRIRLLDGLVGILPCDVDRSLQAGFSNLVDAYKYNERLPGSDLALFRLSSIPIDRAVPNEALLANVAWVRGLPSPTMLLSSRQLAAFRRNDPVHDERSTRGVPGALLACSEFALEPGQRLEWRFCIDGGLDARAVVDLERRLGRGHELSASLGSAIEDDQREDRARLIAHLAAADGIQVTGEPVEDRRHLANTLFNCMRGGTFVAGGEIDLGDFESYLATVAPLAAARTSKTAWPRTMTRDRLVALASATQDLDLERLAREYMPLTFSRRHGDPSRPWNQFSIDTHEADGSPRLRYEGNWRDIFQNWEALLQSYPQFAEAAVFKFVNATTRDGYNPYRISREGFDWESPDPNDPWAHIGYWGDHQIVYLERLLATCERFTPGGLSDAVQRPMFVFADVPYRLANYEQMLADPHETIAFDAARDREIRAQVARLGNEARLVPQGDRATGSPLRATLGEKLLVPVLAKLSNFVPGLGIWMNTQRPEWNDANNALVGRGVSVVTAAHLAHHCATLLRLFSNCGEAPIPVSRAVEVHARRTAAALAEPIAEGDTRSVLDRLGLAGSDYRQCIYNGTATAAESSHLQVTEVLALLAAARAALLATVEANRRSDGLFHSYNLLVVAPDGAIHPRRLPLMLEGQVAVLASGLLSHEDAVTLLDALLASALRRHDLGTYLLYPDRALPTFLEVGRVRDADLATAPDVLRLLERRVDRILRRDAAGTVRFAPELRNAEALMRACAELGLRETEREQLLTLYERVFDHAAFTGRSGTFFGYEGLGCVYWHMVSKLRLAVLETWIAARDSGAPTHVIHGLERHYDDIRRGLGTHLSSERYGAFPSDPYSHTPSHAAVRQPGMTGQVKEDLIARRQELGVFVRDGQLCLGDAALRPGPLLKSTTNSALGTAEQFVVEAGSIGFSVCGVPCTLRPSTKKHAVVHLIDGSTVDVEDGRLDRELSQALFARRGTIASIDVRLPVR